MIHPLAFVIGPWLAFAAAGDAPGDDERLAAWTASLRSDREVVDQVVVCLDASTFLVELGRWREHEFWPVLLWDARLTPKFLAAFAPAEVILARPGGPAAVDLPHGLSAVAKAWGVPRDPPEEKPATTASLLAVLRARGRAPTGAVLLREGSPELLGGLALAAGRFHLPIAFGAPHVLEGETHVTVVSAARVAAYRASLRGAFGDLDVAFDEVLDELDFLTIANDLPFGYTPDGDDVHPGGYTVDDALLRREDQRRNGWVGRFAGGPARSVYMAMCALFLQPRAGLFFSRYDPQNAAFGVFDPAPAEASFAARFPLTTVRHPDATLERWRALQWPRGNRFGFVFVNSSGGARTWSTSAVEATPFDVPDTQPAIVHYTHSGSAGAPFDASTIAGRWMSGGAYIYFGSYAEPYLHAFVPPSELASRVDKGIPLGPAMRHVFDPANVGRVPMKIAGADREVSINVTAPWKLAYFGDPSYVLTGAFPPRRAAAPREQDAYASVSAWKRERPRDKAAAHAHDRLAITLPLLERDRRDPVDLSGWARVLKSADDDAERAALLTAMTEVWIAALEREPSENRYRRDAGRKFAKIPAPIVALLRVGVASDEAADRVSDLVKEVVAGLDQAAGSDAARDSKKLQWALELACLFPCAGPTRAPFFAWIQQSAGALGVDVGVLRAGLLKHAALGDAAREALSKGLPAGS